MNVAEAYPVRKQDNGTRWYKPQDMQGWTSQYKYAHSDYKRKTKRRMVTRAKTRRTGTPKNRQPTVAKGMERNVVVTKEARDKQLEKMDPATRLTIQDPKHPLLLFDGQLRVLSTCRDCGGVMQVIHAFEYVHPCCTPQPTDAESLADNWLWCAMNGDDRGADLIEAEIEKIDGAKPDMKSAALQYISWGWPVFPLLPKGVKSKSGVVSDGKMPATPNGFKDATTDSKRIAKFWDRHPDYNIGLPTGHAFDVIDIDPDKGGVASFSLCLDAKRIPDTHGVVVTSSGGLHLYIPATGKGNRAGVEPGMDYRGKGGYVVAPPSTLGERGRSWSWLTVPSPTLTMGE